jgi:Glycosyltransferase Maf N-terminal domain
MGKLGTKVQVGWQCDPEIWEANLAAWHARGGGKDLLPLCPDQPPRLEGLTRGAGPYPSFQTLGEHGRLVSLHSAQDPWREAESLAERATLEASQTVVALGMGLGYHLLTLLPRLSPTNHLIIVEKEPEVFLAALSALDLTPLWRRPNTWWVVDPDGGAVLRH